MDEAKAYIQTGELPKRMTGDFDPNEDSGKPRVRCCATNGLGRGSGLLPSFADFSHNESSSLLLGERCWHDQLTGHFAYVLCHPAESGPQVQEGR